jgi:WD40 repeat protein
MCKRRISHDPSPLACQAMQRLEGHVDGVASVAFSNDGTLLASGSIFGRTILVPTRVA